MSRRTDTPTPRSLLKFRPQSRSPAKGDDSSDDILLRVARWALALAIVTAAVVLDPFADAAFDAPKLLALKCGALVVVCALLLRSPTSLASEWTLPGTFPSRLVIVLLVAAFAGALAATIFSVHGPVAWHSLAGMLLGASYFLIGASRVISSAAGKRFLALFILLAALNAIVSLMQSMGLQLPFAVERLGGRYPTGAFLGNEGFVALLCALMGACGMALLIAPDATSRTKKIALAISVLAMLSIAVNRQATSAIALAIALGVMLVVKHQQRWLLGWFAAVIAVALVAAVVPSLRAKTWAATPGASVESYQRLTTYRLGGWAAAFEMIEARPWIGHGPGAFAQESTARRLAAEVRLGERFLQPTGATFVYAHQEWLQLAAECGVPTMLMVLAALVIVLQRLMSETAGRASAERLLLLGVLTAGAVATLAWFPLQIPITTMAILLACGRAWRITTQISESAT